MSHLDEENYVCTKTAAKILGVSQSFLERDRVEGPSIPFYKLGRNGGHMVRYLVKDLMDHLGSRRVEALSTRKSGNSRRASIIQPKLNNWRGAE